MAMTYKDYKDFSASASKPTKSGYGWQELIRDLTIALLLAAPAFF